MDPHCLFLGAKECWSEKMKCQLQSICKPYISLGKSMSQHIECLNDCINFKIGRLILELEGERFGGRKWNNTMWFNSSLCSTKKWPNNRVNSMNTVEAFVDTTLLFSKEKIARTYIYVMRIVTHFSKLYISMSCHSYNLAVRCVFTSLFLCHNIS